MREILFRGKTEYGRWVYGNLIHAGDYCCILEPEENVHPMDYPYLDPDLGVIDGRATPVIPETIGQFTGLFDKNGKKIFEEDIVRYKAAFKFDYSDKICDAENIHEFVKVVKYNNGKFWPSQYRADCENYWYAHGSFDIPRWVVAYSTGMKCCSGLQAGWYIQRDDWESWSELKNTNEMAVIGNIHDNPELII